jgi:2-phosphosulfolactate phosphatase
VVVIDVLRATSVIVTALSNGASWVKTVASIEEAFQLKSADVLLGGERHALPIDGFDYSNSPLEYTAERVRNKGIVLTTTNGTLALSKCGSAGEVLIGAFLNHLALTDYLSAQNLPVELICAGTNGEFSLDDFLCAGLICSTLQKSGGFEFDDLGRLAIQSWIQSSLDIHAALSGASHYNVLKSKGFDEDLEYCLKRDTHNVLVRRNSTNRFTLKDFINFGKS